MKFIVKRTSAGWDDGDRVPLDWAEEPQPPPLPGSMREHVMDVGHSDYGYAWVLEVPDLSSLMTIVAREGDIVLCPVGTHDSRAHLPVLEVYDARRE